MPVQFNARYAFRDIYQLINCHHFAAAEVDRHCDHLALHDLLGSQDTIVDVLKATSLMPITPNLDFMVTGKFCGDDFSADGSRRLLATAIVGAMRSVNVVIAGHARNQTEILTEMTAHPFTEKFFP